MPRHTTTWALRSRTRESWTKRSPATAGRLELKPDYAEAHNNLGIALNDQGKPDEAVACYRRALELKPDYAEAHNNLGIACKEQGKLDEAVACYRRALELKPDCVMAHSNLVYTSIFCPGYDAQTIYEEHRRWNQQHAETPGEVHPAPCQRAFGRSSLADRLSSRPISAAIRWDVSCCRCWNRTTMRALKSFCYASVRTPDRITDDCRAHADVWRDVLGWSDEQLAETIRQDRDRHPGGSDDAHGEQPPAGLCPQARPRAGDVSGLLPARRGLARWTIA